MEILKNLFDNDGKTKIGIDEIADDTGRLLGSLINPAEVGNNSSGYYRKHEDGTFEAFGKIRLEPVGARNRLTGYINFPIEALSSEDVVVTGSVGSFANITPSSQNIATTQVVVDNGVRARVYIYVELNSPLFGVDDYIEYTYHVFGKWKE